MATEAFETFKDWEAEQMQDPEFRAAVEELEPAYQAARLRIMRGLTQAELEEDRETAMLAGAVATETEFCSVAEVEGE